MEKTGLDSGAQALRGPKSLQHVVVKMCDEIFNKYRKMQKLFTNAYAAGNPEMIKNKMRTSSAGRIISIHGRRIPIRFNGTTKNIVYAIMHTTTTN